jgi:hypothetical protein
MLGPYELLKLGPCNASINEFAKLASATGESLQGANQTPVVVNNSGSSKANGQNLQTL